MIQMKIRKKVQIGVIIALLAMLLSGCQKAAEKTEVVFTTEFGEDEVFRIDQSSCTLPEINVYMRTTQDQYESVFGSEIFQKDLGGTTLEEQLKSTILARIAQIKVMNLLADSYGLTLSDKEKGLVVKTSKEYMQGLSDEEIKEMGISEETVEKLYREYALANKLYSEITKDVNPEISDDEARTISVKHILIKTYSLSESGNRVDYSDTQKAEAKKRAEEVLSKVSEGEDFDSLVDTYNEDTQSVYAFGKGTMPKAFEEAAFNLDTDQVSGIVETEYGYHIIKCISTFDRDETDANKRKIVEQRKNEAFNQVYGEFVKKLYSNLNTKLWDSVVFEENTKLNTINFFDIYNQNFETS